MVFVAIGQIKLRFPEAADSFGLGCRAQDWPVCCVFLWNPGADCATLLWKAACNEPSDSCEKTAR